ncbi:DUF3077 domain-containing protein [Pseudomonas fulva]|uniref:DUF3077 domain-containing protein n=1 Tax=Pseudomonas TaxID=286 RepID=UPI000B508D2A|nr:MULTISPECIES: DUF3077 domain-containing protein [unclassified Pseudomonas]MDP9665050.1 hypothetical protein [Pseudomonas cremoricolorata]QDC04906.1 DUF3077 domain-containing protein [Pseudomonas sp. SWI7]TFA90458.1 hypothetical protein F473_00978 [Pseudomonas sp. URIL14HWK12:I1]SNB64359.1 Protein of unknown function [Pseudomonas sp. LAIL14HWK12:I4]
MDNDITSPPQGPTVVNATRRFASAGTDLVQMKPALPLRTALVEASVIMGCITELTRKAIDKPADRKNAMLATCYLAAMAKALIDGQLQALRHVREDDVER